MFTLTLTHFLAKTIFSRGYVHKTCGNSGGVRGGGGLLLCSKNGNSGEEGGTCMKFPPWWRYGYFLELHNTTRRYENLNKNIPCLIICVSVIVQMLS